MFHLIPKTMAKIYGLFGSMQGKVADVVMAVRNGEQIARKYQPIVSNPSTQLQVAARAKLKLMSQLSAVMAPVIAIPRKGAVSSRNLFVKENYLLSSYSDNAASINLPGVQLTKSVVSMPAIVAPRTAESFAGAIVPGAAFTIDVDRVVYCLFAIGDDNKLRFVESQVASEKGADGRWPVTFTNISGNALVLAFGVRDNTEAARTTFGNMEVITAQSIANLIVSRTLLETDVTMTETRGVLAPTPNA